MGKMRKNDFIAILCCLAAIAFDQWTKWLAIFYLKEKPSFVLIPGVFELEYLENRGASFGIMQGWQWMFVFFTVLLFPIILYVYRKIPGTRRFFGLRLCAVLLLSGAVGNLIDRIFRKYVVDFLYFSLIDFPIFNVADCYVTIAYIVFLILILFYYKEEDFAEFSFPWKQKN